MSITKGRGALLASALALLAGTAQAQDLSRIVEFKILPNQLSAAIIEFSQQTGVQVVTAGEDVSRLSTAGVSGKLSIAQALQLLLTGTELHFQVVGESTVAVLGRSDKKSLLPVSGYKLDRIAMTSDIDVSGASQSASGMPSRKQDGVEEIVVTGSNIRGAENHAAPVIRVERQDIERTGYASTQQLIQSLPQNFSNVSETTFGAINGGVNETTYGGSGINLRGLGAESTLVLMNGRRLAPSGVGSYVDVTMIPLSAVERVEILTDGASAIYGSDAVAGVVNFVLRQDFSGAETRLRYGTVTAGDHNETQLAQVLGQSWNSGHAMLAYEYLHRTPLDGFDRDFVRPNALLRRFEPIQGQDRHSVLGTISQKLSDRFDVTADVRYSQRDSSYYYDIGALYYTESKVEQYGGALQLSADLAGDWQARLSGQLDLTDAQEQSSIFSANQSQTWSTELAADGTIVNIPGGAIRLAVGTQFRDEEFEEGRRSIASKLARDVVAAYAELNVPLVGVSNRRGGIERLELTLAGRYEDYSDFGNTFNPKVGLAWAPVDGVNVRGSWGTSFRAPVLSRINPADRTAVWYQGSFIDYGGNTTALMLSGSGENLGPEESRSWTAGFDLTPSAVPGLKLAVTYFNVDYDDRIRTPFPSGYNLFGVLVDPTYAAIVTRNPSLEEINAYRAQLPRSMCFMANGAFFSPCANPPVGDVTAIVDERWRNLASVQMEGLDFSLGYRVSTQTGDWGFELAGQKLLESREQLVAGAEYTTQMNKAWSPVDLRLRGNVSYALRSFSVSAFANYTDSYRDGRSARLAGAGQRAEVGSWLTFDVSLQYDVGRLIASEAMPELALSLNAINVLDRDPPFISSPLGINYDGVNANPLGRFVGAQLVARW
ncbi:TonB-dependent receptor [Peristeroidobacter soli]|jgi:outer membrane cobalamin receptor|uniref:TonB-dependent receptor n=1 Tax=Peristeroidobacter soli TaxID=2497877 RepID=UPI00101C5878|nr:TonB-dependent receptor [Peristeroidobacter soli]